MIKRASLKCIFVIMLVYLSQGISLAVDVTPLEINHKSDDYSINEDVTIEITSPSGLITDLIESQQLIDDSQNLDLIDIGYGVQLPPPDVVKDTPEVYVLDNALQKLDIAELTLDSISDGTQASTVSTAISIAKENLKTPGKYTLVIELDGKRYEQDFTWGVLAINTNKSIYKAGDKAHFSMAVLDKEGNMVCDAKLFLTLSKDGKQVASLKSGEEIIVNDICNVHAYSETPDYEAFYILRDSGLYSIELTAITNDSKYTIFDSFEVEETPEFEVERLTATRIYPVEKYPVKIKVKANTDFSGVIVEKVPDEFDLFLSADVKNFDSIEVQENVKLVKWFVDLKKGQEITLGYSYDSPDDSPMLYTLGPLELLQDETDLTFSETRLWQLAIDAVGAAKPTRLYSTGFELNSTTTGMEYDTNINSPAISSSTYRSGAYALNTAITGSDNTEGVRMQITSADSATGFVARAYLRIATTPNTTISIMQFASATDTAHVSVRLTTSNTLQLYSDTSAVQIGSDSTALSTNTWYRLEFLADSNGSGTSRMALRIDGEEVARTTTGTIGGVAASVAKFQIGILSSGQADLFWDDIGINSDAFTNMDNWPGEGKIVYLRPNGNGATDLCANDYTAVDETPPNDATDYITCDIANDADRYTLTDSSTAGIGANDYIRLIEGWQRSAGSATSAGSRSHTFRFHSGANEEVNTAIAINSTNWITNDDGLPRNADITIYDDVGTANYGELTTTELDGLDVTITATDATPDIFFTAVWVLVEYVPYEGGRIYSSGFELQSTAAGVEWSAVAGTIATSTGTKRTGNAALEVTGLASATEESLSYNLTVSGVDTEGPLFFRAYLYITTAPSAENRIYEVKNNAGTTIAYISLDNSRVLRLYDEDGAVGSASSALAATTWYRIELKIDATGGGSTDTVEAKIDGSVFATSSTRNLSSGVRTFLLGGNMNGEAQTTGTWYFDDVGINMSRGSLQNGYPGHGKIVHLIPTGNGTQTAWTNTYTNVDEVPPNDATDIISTSSNNGLESYNVTDATGLVTSGASITLVSAGFRFLNATAVSAANIKICGTSCLNYVESLALATSANTWFTNQIAEPWSHPLTTYTQYNTNLPWTIAELDNTQVALRLQVDGGTNVFSVSTIWLLVEYDDSTPPIDVTGTCDAFDQTTDCGDTGTLRIAVNGELLSVTQNTVSGAWTIADVPQPTTGDIVTVFIDGASDTDEAVAVTQYDGSGDITGVKLYKEHLTIGSVDNQTLSNTELGSYDNSVSGDEDIFFDVSSGNLTVDSTSQSTTERLYIDASDTFQPGGSVSTHDIEIDGTFTAEANALTISGSWNNDSNFSSTGTTTFTATSGTETIDSTGSSTNSFHNLTLGSGSGSATWNMSSALDINNDLTISYGTLAQNGSNNITLAGSMSIGASGNYTKSTGTFTFDGTTAETFTNTNSTITFDAASSSEIAPAATAYSWSHTVGSNNDRILVVGVGIRGNVAVSSVTYNGDSLTFAREEHPGGDVRTEIWYLLTPDTGTNTVTVTLASSQSSSAGAVSYYNVGGVISNAGDDDGGSADTASSVVLASETGQLVVDTISVQSSSNALRVGLNQTQRVNYVGTHNSTAISDEVGTLSTNSTWQFTSNYWAGVAISLRPAATLDNLGTVVFNKTDTVAPATNNKVTLASSMVTDNVTINGTGGQADTLDLGSSGYILELKNAGSTADVLTNSGTLTIGTSTIKFSATNSGGNININNLPYSSLQVSGGETYVLTGNQTSANAITGSLEIDYGATLDVTSTPYNITLEDNWSNWGTFTAQTGTVTIAGTGTSNIKGITSFNNFSSSTAAKVIAFQSANTYSTPYTTFGGTVTLTGGSPANSANNISIQSDSSGTQWLANFSTTQSGSTYLKVQDSGCYSGTSDINLNSTSVDVSGNDSSCWIFGGLSADIVDSGGSPVASPNVALVTKSFQFTYQNGAGTLGLPSEKIRITNSTGSPAWSLSIAATGGPTAFWDGTSSDYDFNDGTSQAGDGADTDSLGGQLSIDPSSGNSTPQGGCTNTGITLGSAGAFNEVTPVNSITLVTAGGSADTNCYWDITDMDVTQTIPSEQLPSTYVIDLTLTIL